MNFLNLMATLGLDKKNYENGLKEAENQGQNSGSKIGNALGNAAKVGLGLVTAATGAAATGLAVMAKQAVSSYAQYEQLVGGVEKLYQDASNKVIDYANRAYKTSGMSANRYMEVATSFSASLINSLGGDMDKAADMTDIAMRSISDNVNVFGSDMESVQYAFQGFAKQNYTMLDNLKLGYGGTKTEMERLIKDANEYAATIGEASDLSIDSFADVVKAIDLIQQKQGIAGTTAKEAMHTIEGAANATKAAWKNVITAIAGGGDLQKAFDGLIQSLFGDGSEGSGLLANIIPRIQKTMEGIGQFVSKASPYIAKYLPQLFESILPPLLDSAVQLMVSLAASLPSIIKVIIDTIPKLMQAVAQALQKEFPVIGGIFEGLATIVEKVFGFIANNGEAVMAVLSGILAGFVAFKAANFLMTAIPQLITMVTTMVTTLTGTIAATELMVVASTGLTGAFGGLTVAVEMLNTALLANPIGLVVGAIVGAIAVLGVAIYHLATEEEAIKSVNEAEEAYIDAKQRHQDAINGVIDAEERLRQAQEQLTKAEQDTGQNAEDLYNRVFVDGTTSIGELTDAQLDLVNKYKELKDAQDQHTQSSLENIAAMREENTKFFEGVAADIKENGGSWNEYRDNVVNAFNEGNISAEQARDLLGGAMSEMSSDAQLTYLHDIPDSIKSGLNVQNYETDWQHLKNTWSATGHAITGDWGKSMDDLKRESQEGGSESGSNLTSGLQLGIGSGWSGAITTVISFGKNIISSLKKALDEASPSKATKEMGGFLVEGLNVGIKKSEKTSFKQVKTFGKGVLDTFKDFFKIHSPSQVMRDEIGKQLAFGVAFGIKANEKYATASADEMGKAILSVAQKTLDNYKVYHEVSLEEEAGYWQDVRALTEDGTQARIDADKKALEASKKYYEAQEKMRNDTYNKTKTFTQKLADLYTNLQNDIQKLNDAYDDALQSRVNFIMGFTNLFDMVSLDESEGKDKLLFNLQDQVNQLQTWDYELTTLTKRLGENNPLVAALESMGVKSVNNLRALNEMSEAELQEYARLYERKQEIATSRATKELEQMRKDTDAQIELLRQQFNTAMKELHDNYVADMKDLSATATAGGKDVGASMIDGMRNGLLEGSSELANVSRLVAQQAFAAAKKELGIASPSKKFIFIGKMVDAGFVEGIKQGAKDIEKQVHDTLNVDDYVGNYDNNISNKSQSRQGGYNQTINVYSPKVLTPYEVARQTRNATKNMILSMSGV